MSRGLSFNDLVQYTDWERGLWHEHLRKHGDKVLAINAGPNGDGRFETVGDLVRHVFSAEKRYIDRLANRPLTDTGAIPTDRVEPLFEFGRQSRKDLREFLAAFPAHEWDVEHEYTILKFTVRATPKKIVAHVLMHEVRHWAQISTICRLSGMAGEMHDLLGSPVFGGGFERAAG